MDTKTMKYAIETHNLDVTYNSNRVLQKLKLYVTEGETVAIIGRSGCGKSTLLRSLCVLQKPDNGDIFLHGQQIVEKGVPKYDEWEIRRNITMVPQTLALLPHMTVRNNISLGLITIKGLSKSKSDEKTKEIASYLGIVDVLDSYPEELSGGQSQRVQLARAVILQPDVLLLDEVTSSIDPQTTREVVSALWRLRELEKVDGRPQTIIIVTHELSFAFNYADRIAFLHEGRIFEESEAKQFADKCKMRETQDFIKAEMGLPISGNA